MFSPFQVSPSETPYPIPSPPASMRVLPPPPPLWGCSPPNSHTPALAFPYTGASKTLMPKGLSSQWCPTRPSSAAYVASAMGPSMCILWLTVQSPGALEGLTGWHCCTPLHPPHGSANPLKLLQSLLQTLHWGSLSSDQWLATSIRLWICQALAEPLRRQPGLTGGGSCQQALLGIHNSTPGLVTVYEMANVHLSVSAYHVFFCDWVTSLRMIFSSSIHLPVVIMEVFTSGFFKAIWSRIHRVHRLVCFLRVHHTGLFFHLCQGLNSNTGVDMIEWPTSWTWLFYPTLHCSHRIPWPVVSSGRWSFDLWLIYSEICIHNRAWIPKT
jgi:hypothetical protein